MCEDTYNLQNVADLAAKWLEIQVIAYLEFKVRLLKKFLRYCIKPKGRKLLGWKRVFLVWVLELHAVTLRLFSVITSSFLYKYYLWIIFRIMKSTSEHADHAVYDSVAK